MPSTTSYRPADVVLVAFPFTGGTGAKQRPALVLLDTGDRDVLLARVTTQPYTTPYDVALVDWNEAGLLAPSVVRLHKVATLDKSLITQVLGHLTDADTQRVSSVLQQTFGAWP